jgi:hypothetical protein
MNMRNHSFVALLTSLLAAGAASHGTQVDLGKLPPAASKQGVTFEKDIRPLFEASCLRCHGAERPKGGLRLDSLDAVLKGGREGKVVQPGKSKESVLVVAVAQINEENAMPPKPKARGGGPGAGGPPPGGGHGGGKDGPPPPPKPLTAEQVGLVRAWIDQGAK